MESTLLLSPRYHGDSRDVWRAATKRDWLTHRCINYSAPADLTEACVYGEILFCDIMADRCDLALLDPPDNWLPSLPPDLVLRDVDMCFAGEIPRYTTKKFFKPANDKVFQYGIYPSGRDVPTRYVHPDCPCLVSEVVDWDIDVRCWVLDGKVATLDYYRLYGEVSEEQARADTVGCGWAAGDKGKILSLGMDAGKPEARLARLSDAHPPNHFLENLAPVSAHPPNHCQRCGAKRQDFGVVCHDCFMAHRYEGERKAAGFRVGGPNG